jgi:hypothetical protein
MSKKLKGRGKARRALTDALLEPLCREVLCGAKDLLTIDDPLEAELWASELVGTWSSLPLIDGDPHRVFGEALIRGVRRRRSPEALAVLLALAAVGPPRLAEKAHRVAREHQAAGMRAPAWAAQAGRAVAVDAWIAGDPCGDQDVVFVAFRHGKRPAHTLVALIDHNLEGAVKDAFMAGPPRAVLGDWNRRSELEAEPVSVAYAAGMLALGIQARANWVDPPSSPEYRQVEALLMAWLHRVGAETTQTSTPDPVSLTGEERVALIADFVAAPEAVGLSEAAGFIASCLVDYRCDYGDGDPLRWSPALVEVCLGDWFPRKITADEKTMAAVPGTMRAWLRYVARRCGTDEVVAAETLAAVDEVEAAFLKAAADPACYGMAKSLAMAMIADGVEPGDDEAMQNWIVGFNARPEAERRALLEIG